MILQTFLSAVISFLFSLVGTRGMMALPILDKPKEERSSHKVPTPTSGGAVVILTYILFLFMNKVALDQEILIILLGAGVVATIGFIDEFKEISFKVRLIIQLVVGATVIILILKPSFTFLSILYFLMLLILLGGFMNAFNFIDGLNGMSGGAALVAALFASFYFQEQSILYLAIVPALLGFLVFNVKGKIFIGDVGSLFLGFIFPALLLLRSQQLNSSILVLGHLFFFYFSDVSVTIIRRLRAGLTVVNPHRDFFFLRLHRAGLSHLSVAGIYAGFTTLQGLILMVVPLTTKTSFIILYCFDILLYSFVLYVINQYFQRKVVA